MNRQISFVVLDAADKVIARYTPEYVTALSGLGVSRNIQEVEAEQRRFITQINPRLQDIGIAIWFDGDGDNAYLKSRAFKSWELEQTRLGQSIAIEYNDGQQLNYINGIIQSVPLSERTVGRRLRRDINFHPLTPWFSLIARRAVIQRAISGKTYPLRYPYTYGSMRITDNELFNDFYKPVPLKVTLHGFMANPKIQLLDERGQPYSQIWLDGIEIPPMPEGEIDERKRPYVLLDGDVRQIQLWTGTEFRDIFSSRNPAFDSYFQINPGKSIINWNPNPGENGWLEATRRQFTEL